MQWDRKWTSGTLDVATTTASRRPVGPIPIERVVTGEIMANEKGTFFHTRDYCNLRIADSPNTPTSKGRHALAVAANKPEIAELELDRAIFIDTETTSLSGGTGTYAFLIGCGWIENQRFRVDQFFIRNPSEEPSLLDHLESTLKKFEWVISFNGTTFDLPLIQTRLIMNRRRFSIVALASLDLLQVARRLWRYRLNDRSLGSLESSILDIRRGPDVAGHLIPSLYLQYLRSGDARPLGRIFSHNRQDIVSMALLIEHVTNVLANWTTDEKNGSTVLGIARAHHMAGDVDTALAAYSRALDLSLDQTSETLAQREVSLIHKRAHDWSVVLTIWNQMALRNDRDAIWALVELAKYHEHRSHDWQSALRYARRARDLSVQDQISIPLRLGTLAIDHRIARIEHHLDAQLHRPNE